MKKKTNYRVYSNKMTSMISVSGEDRQSLQKGTHGNSVGFSSATNPIMKSEDSNFLSINMVVVFLCETTGHES